MSVIDHVLYAGCYLPARSSFMDGPCSLDPSPYGTAVRWRCGGAAEAFAAPLEEPAGPAVLSALEVVEVAFLPRWRVCYLSWRG